MYVEHHNNDHQDNTRHLCRWTHAAYIKYDITPIRHKQVPREIKVGMLSVKVSFKSSHSVDTLRDSMCNDFMTELESVLDEFFPKKIEQKTECHG